jgi:outer membrane protein assembly factor BamC
MISRATRFLLPGLLALGLVGCSWLPSTDSILPDRKVEYKHEKQAERNLEIPPDLTKGSGESVPGIGGASYSQFVDQRQQAARAATGAQVLPKPKNVEMRRDGDQRWLVIQASPDEVWSQVVAFWQQNGILLEEQDPNAGVMRTAWVENRADIKSDFITNKLRGFVDGLYSAASRDQYRVRLERGQQPGTTELYLTERGMQETFASGTTGEKQQSVWVPRPTDHGLEAIMLQRLMSYLGASTEEELTQTRAGTMLAINEEFPRAWRMTGVALDRVGFAVEDRDRAKGVYLVRYSDPFADQESQGLLSKLAFWRASRKIDKERQYQVSLRPQGSTTVVVVLDKNGQRTNSETATRILNLIHEQLR